MMTKKRELIDAIKIALCGCCVTRFTPDKNTKTYKDLKFCDDICFNTYKNICGMED